MRTKKIALIGLVACAIALTGCSKKDTPPTANTPTSAAPQANAKDAFLAAVKKTGEVTSKMDMTISGAATVAGTGVTDRPNKTASMKMKIEASGTKIDAEFIAINGEAWLKFTGVPAMGDKWMHIPASKVKAGGTIAQMTSGDPSGVDSYAKSVVSVERDGANGFKGTLDATQSGGGANKDAIKALGDKAKALPFSATVDDQGRLVTFTLHMDGVTPGAGKVESKYSGFGEPVTVTAPPAADVIEAPQTIIDSF